MYIHTYICFNIRDPGPGDFAGPLGSGPGPGRRATSPMPDARAARDKGSTFGDFGGPAGSPKSTKNGSGTEKVRPETSPEAFFVGFSCRCRSESLSGAIFGGSDPSKSCYFLGGSTILTKSPFSKKHRKSSLRGPVLGPKMAKKRRRGHPKSPKMAKKVNF